MSIQSCGAFRKVVLMLFRTYLFRKITDALITALMLLAVVTALIPLVSILWHTFRQGWSAMNWSFFTHLPKPVGEPGGGIANALVGSGLLILLASAIGIPFGVLVGIYLAEFNPRGLGTAVRFTNDVLTGIPSIVTGMFIYALLVVTMGGFSALAGGVALGLLMIPTVTRSTEEMLKMVPQSLREASLALGATPTQTILRVVLPAALPGILTGIMLAVARVAGETAPLLFTAFGNRFWSLRLDQPIAALPLQIFTYAISPYRDWQNQAWGAALVLVGLVLVLNVFAGLAYSRASRFRR